MGDNKFFGKFEQERLLSTLDELDAVDQTLSKVEDLVLSRSTSTHVPLPAEEAEQSASEGLFLRFYPLILTILFLILVVGGNIFFNLGDWSMWLPYFVLSALSFVLPHPYGAVLTLLVALAVAASSFV